LRHGTIPNGQRFNVVLELRVRNFPGGDGFELKLVRELRDGAISSEYRPTNMRVVRTGDVFGIDGVEHQRVCVLRRRQDRSPTWCFGVRGLRGRTIPDRYGLVGVRKLRRGFVFGVDGFNDKRLFELYRRAIPNAERFVWLRRVHCGHVFGLHGLWQQFVPLVRPR